MQTVTSPVTVIDGRPAPLTGCNCTVCREMRRRQAQDRDLAENYAAYLRGELVSRDEDE